MDRALQSLTYMELYSATVLRQHNTALAVIKQLESDCADVAARITGAPVFFHAWDWQTFNARALPFPWSDDRLADLTLDLLIALVTRDCLTIAEAIDELQYLLHYLTRYARCYTELVTSLH